MNRFSKMMAVFMTISILATAPGVTPFAAFAVTLGQPSGGVRTANINMSNVAGSLTGLGGSNGRLRTTQGASVNGFLGITLGAPVVGLNGAAIVAPMIAPGHEAMPFPNVQRSVFSLDNDLISASQESYIKTNGMGRVATPEMDIQGGRIKFDGSSKGLKNDEVPALSAAYVNTAAGQRTWPGGTKLTSFTWPGGAKLASEIPQTPAANRMSNKDRLAWLYEKVIDLLEDGSVAVRQYVLLPLFILGLFSMAVILLGPFAILLFALPLSQGFRAW